MKTLRNIFIFIFLLNQGLSWSQKNTMRAYLDTKQFYHPSAGNYIEIHLQFVGYSITNESIPGGLQSRVAVKYELISTKNDTLRDAYLLTSPLYKDSIIDDFYDIRRLAIEPGKYLMKIELKDVLSKNDPIKAQQEINIEDFSSQASISDIEIAEYAYPDTNVSPFQKSGFYLIPRISNFYPSQLTKIPSYFEIYNVSSAVDSIVGVKQTIVNAETGAVLENFESFNRLKPTSITPMFKSIDITYLPSGKYALNYTLLNKNMRDVSMQSYIFERSNEFTDSIHMDDLVLDPAFQASITEDSVAFFLESLLPISKPAEIKNIILSLKEKNTAQMRKHIQAYWKKVSPTQSYDAWLKYKGQVQLIERLYSSNFQNGYETDRGRVYLKYGAPSSINARETSPSEYPYEIWVYNKIGVFSNKRFVFYNPDLVNNAYRLLHSDMLGELKNPAWQQILVKRNTNNGTVDDPNKYNQKAWGSNSYDLFRQY